MPDGEGSLTRRAELTFISQLLAQGAATISGFVFTPLVVHGLDKEMYGAWGMVTSTVGFVGLTNLSATSILKLVLGVRQHSDDLAEKRRLIGAAVWQWLVLLPVVVAFCALLVALSPRLIVVSPEHRAAIYWTMTLMALSIPLTQICSIPGGVLSGQNLNYKAMGLNAAMVLIGGALNALGVQAGFGLRMLAVTSLISIVLASGVRLLVVRRCVPWFGAERPTRAEIREMIRLSIPGSLGTAASSLLSSADALLIGYLFGPASVSIYLLTGSLVRYLTYPLTEILKSGNSGIGFLVGKGEWKRLAHLRLELHQTALWGFGVIGAIVLMANRLFVGVWVGESFYGGLVLDVAIVLAAFFRQLVQIDAIPLDASLRLFPKVNTMILWSAIGLAIGWGLQGVVGVAGIPLGIAAGQFGLWCTFQYLLRRFTQLPIRRHLAGMLRPAAVFCLGLGWWGCIRAYRPCQSGTWLATLATGAVVAICAAAVYGALGLSPSVRASLWRRFDLRPSAVALLRRFSVALQKPRGTV